MDEPIHIAILGAGSRGIDLLRAFDGLSGCTVAATADPNLSRLFYIQEWFPHVAVTPDQTQLLHDPAVNLVVVATPLASRVSLAAAALTAGKHVLVEGPLATSVEEAAHLVALAARQNKLLTATHDAVYHPAVAEMKTLLALGRLGDLYYLESARSRPAESAGEGNSIWNLAAADIAIALYLVGEQPLHVQATGQSFTQPDRLDVAFITIHYPGGRFSHHHVSCLAPQRSHRFQVIGRAGAMAFNEARTSELLRLCSAGPADSQVARATAVITYDLNDLVFAGQESAIPLVRQSAAFLEAVRTGRPLPLDTGLSLNVVRVLAAAERSIQQNGTLIALMDVKN